MKRLLAIGLLLALPLASAQASYGGPDAAGDVDYEVVGVGTYPAVAEHDGIDVVALAIEAETETTFDVVMSLAGDDATTTFPDLEVQFQHGGVLYRLPYGPCGDGPSGDLALERFNEAAAAWNTVACVPYAFDGATLRYTIDKLHIEDATGIQLGFGGVLDGLWASTRSLVAPSPVGVGTTYAVDRAPDEGVFSGGLSMAFGEGGFGELVLSTVSPFRASNGGPDTVVYPVRIGNLGSVDRAVVLATDGVPNGWDVRLPGRIAVPAASNVTFPVVVTTASAHSHGATEEFVLLAQAGGHVGRLSLGIHYLDIPQLAGHHSTVFFHSREVDTGGIIFVGGDPPLIPWFNTVAQIAGAVDAPFGPNANSQQTIDGGEVRFDADWHIPLDPALLIGMDFETDKVGDLTIGFVSEQSTGPMFVQARLMHCHARAQDGEAPGSLDCPGGSWFELAGSGQAAIDLTPGARLTWETELAVTEYADLVPYVDGSNIALWLDAYRGPQGVLGEAPRIDPTGSMMRLPLLEYKDPIDAAFEDLTSLRLTPLDPFEKKANPGQTVWFTFDVHNAGGSRTVAANTFGHNAAWAKVNPERLHLAPEGAGRFHLGIDVPSGAATGEFAEVLLLVEDADDPAVTAVSKVRVVVVDEEVPTEPAPDMDVKDRESPAMFVAAIGAVALAALRRRH